MAEDFQIKVDQRSIDRALKRLDKYSNHAIADRFKMVVKTGLGLMVSPIRAGATRHNKTGKTAAGVKVRTLKLRSGETVAYKVGPNSPAAHLVIQGHRIVPQGTDTGRSTSGDAYVDRAITALEPTVRAFVDEQMAAL